MKRYVSAFLLLLLAFGLCTSALVHSDTDVAQPTRVVAAIAAAPIAPEAYWQRLKEAVDLSPDTELEFTHTKPVWESYSVTFTAFNWTDTDVDGIADLLLAFKTFVGDLGRYFTQITTNLARVVPNTINNLKNYFTYYLACVRDLANYVGEVLPFRHITVKYWKHVAVCLIPADWQKLIDDGVYVNEWYTDEYTAHRGGR